MRSALILRDALVTWSHTILRARSLTFEKRVIITPKDWFGIERVSCHWLSVVFHEEICTLKYEWAVNGINNVISRVLIRKGLRTTIWTGSILTLFRSFLIMAKVIRKYNVTVSCQSQEAFKMYLVFISYIKYIANHRAWRGTPNHHRHIPPLAVGGCGVLRGSWSLYPRVSMFWTKACGFWPNSRYWWRFCAVLICRKVFFLDKLGLSYSCFTELVVFMHSGKSIKLVLVPILTGLRVDWKAKFQLSSRPNEKGAIQLLVIMHGCQWD